MCGELILGRVPPPGEPGECGENVQPKKRLSDTSWHSSFASHSPATPAVPPYLFIRIPFACGPGGAALPFDLRSSTS